MKKYLIWKEYFPNFLIACDTSKDNINFEEFLEKDTNGILFCASKHREGSDIKNLDCCIFLDKVENRNSKTFVQCIGRVLRRDKNNIKTHGLILDLKANSCLKLCDRMNQYLNSSDNFPWNYDLKHLKINDKKVLQSINSQR